MGKTGKERRGQRYVDDEEVVAPSVITLNAVGAAHACDDFMHFMTGLARTGLSLDYAHYDSRMRAMSLSAPRRDADCPECGSGPNSRFGHGTTGSDLPTLSD